MSLNVSLQQNMVKSGIDTSVLKEVTQQIFKRAESKTVDLTSLDLSKFKRADLGMGLYSGHVDATTARQVAMTNSGMQVSLNENTIATLQYLNNKASEVALKNVDGRIAVAANEESQKTKNVVSLPKFNELVKTTDLSQDKNGSNPFYRGELLNNKTSEKKETEKEILNIFA